jgi:hypothetical protein
MRIQTVILVLVATLASGLPVSAQGVAGFPQPRRVNPTLQDHKFRWGQSLIVAAPIGDMLGSCDAYHRGNMETGIFLRGSSSCRDRSLVMVGQVALYSFLHYEIFRHLAYRESKWKRVVGYLAVPLAAGIAHGYAAQRNFRLPDGPPRPFDGTGLPGLGVR